MEQKITQILKEDAKNIHLLIAEDDAVMQAMYRKLFEKMFASLTIANNGAEAYEYFSSSKRSPIDLIITDNYMPKMNGIELVQKIREKDFGVHIIVITSEDNFNTLKRYMLHGIDAILPKPYNEELTTKVLQRILYHINEKKLLEHYVNQLELMAQDNVAMRTQQLKSHDDKERTPKLTRSDSVKDTPKETGSLVGKYNIRSSVKDMEDVSVEQLDIFGIERIEIFRDNIANYESMLCSLDGCTLVTLRKVLKETLDGISELIQAMNLLGVFPVAVNAAMNLIEFIEKLDDKSLQDKNKRDLMIDILITMLEDFDKWIDLVFISKKTENIHYFDASFANTCLELEMVFKTDESEQHDDDVLEFF